MDEKSDVYSFGVVLLELITGRRPIGGFGDGVDIVQWVRKTTSELGTMVGLGPLVLAIVDVRRPVGCSMERIENLFKVAIFCVKEKGEDRPTMREVVHMLTNQISLIR